jgi:chitodextrinase
MRSCLAAGAVLAVFAVLAPAASAAGRDRTPPSTPTGLRVVAVTEDSITIGWNASKDNSGRIHAYIAGGIYHPGASTVKTFTSLVPSWTQTYRVQAMDPSGNVSQLSAPVTATTASDTTAPTTPANLRVTGTGISTVSLAWDRSSDRWSFSYEVLMDGEVVGGTTGITFGPLTFKVRHVEPGTTHRFTVRARDHSGNLGPDSNVAEGTTVASSDRTPPSAPTNLTATTPPDDFCGSNMLQWTASTDDTDPPSAIEYEVYLHGSLFHVTQPGAAHAFLYTFAGTNTWTVVAVDRAGNSSPPSNAATVTVRADPDFC